jgi:hypothetical protein
MVFVDVPIDFPTNRQWVTQNLGSWQNSWEYPLEDGLILPWNPNALACIIERPIVLVKIYGDSLVKHGSSHPSLTCVSIRGAKSDGVLLAMEKSILRRMSLPALLY